MLSTDVANAAQDAAAKDAAAREAVALKNEADRRGYAVGMNIGNAVRRETADRPADLNVDLIVQGFRDAFTRGRTLLTESEMRTILNELRAELKTRQALGRGENAVGAKPAAMASPAIRIAFRLDPRLTKGLYMGDRWVSPPYSRVGEGMQVTIEARAEGLDQEGRALHAGLKWKPTDPEMVTVTPSEGKTVTITVLRAGESKLRVSFERGSRELLVKGVEKGQALQVEISEAP